MRVLTAIQGESENLGEVLSGDRIEKNSLYEVRDDPGDMDNGGLERRVLSHSDAD